MHRLNTENRDKEKLFCSGRKRGKRKERGVGEKEFPIQFFLYLKLAIKSGGEKEEEED